MKASQITKYSKYMVVSIVVLLIIVGGVNWFIDPYGLLNSPALARLNVQKPALENNNSSLAKAYALRRIKPSSLILGTSRAEVGLDPDYEGWTYKPVYNAGLPAGSIYSIYRFFQLSKAVHPLKQVILGLDFRSFNTAGNQISNAEDAVLSVNSDGKPATSPRLIVLNLFSWDTLVASLKTVTGQGNFASTNGMIPSATMKAGVITIGGHRAYFLNTAHIYATSNYLPELYRYDTVDVVSSPFTYYRKILEIAYRDGIDLRMFISPSHAIQWEVLANSNLWPQFEEWRRSLVAINEEEAQQFGQAPFPLWDFSTYNEFTMETIPPLHDTTTSMNWYWDSSHYKKELGDFVLDKVLNNLESRGVDPDDFGVLLTSKNIETHLEKIRADRQLYIESIPEEARRIEAICGELLQTIK